MANHAYARCPGATAAAFWDAFAAGTAAALPRFDGAAVLVDDGRLGGPIRVDLVDPDTGAVAASAAFWLNNRSEVEWRHPPDTGLAWWFQETIAAQACRAAAAALGAPVMLADDGIEELTEPCFDLRYPRLRDWVDAPYHSLAGLGGALGALASAALFAKGLAERVPRAPTALERIVNHAAAPSAAKPL